MQHKHFCFCLFKELTKSNDALLKPALLVAVPTQDELAAIEEVSAHAAEVTNSMLSQKLELEQKKRSVSMLQKALVGDYCYIQIM